MPLSKNGKPRRVLILGPLPPPHGGSRVSFARFLEYVRAERELVVSHIDLPVRKQRPDGGHGGVARLRTAIRTLGAILRIPRADRVVLFASHGTAFSYGLLLIIAARAFGKPFALRLFGGRPYLHVISRKGLVRRFTEWALSRASSISLETAVGRGDFPDSLRSRVREIRGYRSRVQRAPSPRIDDDVFRFVYAGRVDRTKGIDILIEACGILADEAHPRHFRVDCFGAPSPEIERMSRNQDRLRLKGMVENDAYLAQLPSYDAFVYPSVYDNEGHPGALIEAMLCGLPIVCTSLPAVMEIVTNRVEGLTVEPGSAEDLAAAMYAILSDPQLRTGLAEGSRLRGLMFDEDVVIPKLLKEMGLRPTNHET